MNLADARLVLRPRSQAELLDLAAQWCFSRDWALYTRLSAMVLLPSLSVCIVARWLGEWTWPQVWGLAIALATLSQGVFTVATSRALFERDVVATDVLRRFGQRLPSYLGALVITRLMLMVGAMTVLLLPWAWGKVVFVHEASLLEGSSSFRATERAWNMARSHATQLLLLLGGMASALAFAVSAAELLGHGLVEFVLQLQRPFGSLWDDGGSLYALVGFHVAIPYLAVARFLGYVDQRTRGDGWDLQLRLMALATEHADSVRRGS